MTRIPSESCSRFRKTRDRFPRFLPLILFLAFTGCATVEERPSVRSAWTRTELFLSAIPEADWNAFLAEVVTPRFPAGLTVIEAGGQWRGRDGNIHKVPSRILVLLHPGTLETNIALDDIRREFKTRFNQESVLRADSPAIVSF